MSTGLIEGNGVASISNPFDGVILVALTINMLGDSRKVKVSKVEVDTDKSMIRVNKKIFECAEYKAIQSLAGEIRGYLRSKSVPGANAILRSGTYPIPVSMIEEVDGNLQEYKDRMMGSNGVVSKFLDVYESRKREAMKRLKDLADDKDYPSVEKVREHYDMTYSYVSIGPPERLRSVSNNIYTREQEKIREQCMAVSSDIQLAMREMFQKLLAHMVETLKPGPDGKKNKFKNTLVTNMREFLDDFNKKNITNDEELEQLVQRVQRIMSGRDPETLRQDDDIRDMTARSLESVKRAVDGAIEKMPVRYIREESDE